MIKAIKENIKTTITISSVVAVFGFYTALTQVLDQRYALAEEAQQIQQTIDVYMEKELEDKIFLLQLKVENKTASDVDKAMKKRYESRLEDLRK